MFGLINLSHIIYANSQVDMFIYQISNFISKILIINNTIHVRESKSII